MTCCGALLGCTISQVRISFLASLPAPLQFLAPYSGSAMGEHLKNNGVPAHNNKLHFALLCAAWYHKA